MDKNTLEVTAFGFSFKANGIAAMIILMTFLLTVSALVLTVAGPQLVAAMVAG